MTGFLGEIGKQLADRWVALLAVPGLLYVVAVTAAVVLGRGHALDYPALSRQVTGWAAGPSLRSAGGTALFITGALAGSVLAGLAAAAVGRVAEMLWVLRGERRPARWLAEWRRTRAQRLKGIADDPAASREQVRKAMEKADRICVIAPDRPTWIGDRLRACQVRARQAYGLDLNAAWPRLWLIMPDIARAEIGTAYDAYRGAARLTGWAVLYVILGLGWWPAIMIAVAAEIAAVIKARAAAGTLADLIEAAVDLYGRDLAAQLGETGSGRVTPATGLRLTALMRKSRWDPGSPAAD
jgi:hypothetical protein